MNFVFKLTLLTLLLNVLSIECNDKVDKLKIGIKKRVSRHPTRKIEQFSIKILELGRRLHAEEQKR
jgi:hypothetical protein